MKYVFMGEVTIATILNINDDYITVHYKPNFQNVSKQKNTVR